MDEDDSYFSDESDDSDYNETDYEAQAFEHVFLRPILAKTDVKATTICKLLAMEKSHLDSMWIDFKEELGLLLAEA